MMTLSQAAEVLRKYLWVIVVVVLAVVITPLVFLSFTKKTAPLISLPSPAFEQIAIETGSYNATNLDLPQQYPKTLPVFSQNPKAGFLSSAQTIANKLGFTAPAIEANDVDLGPGKIYSNPPKALFIYDGQLVLQQPSSQNNQADSSNESLNRKATDMISSLGVAPNLTAPNTIYYKAVDEFLEKLPSPEGATLIELIYRFKINEYELLAPQLPVQVSFTPKGNLTQIVLSPEPSLKEQTVLETLPPKSALDLLQKGQGALVETSAPNDYSRLPSKIENAQIETMHLAYYLPKDTEALVEPVWVFKGKDNISGGEFTYVISAIRR